MATPTKRIPTRPGRETARATRPAPAARAAAAQADQAGEAADGDGAADEQPAAAASSDPCIVTVRANAPVRVIVELNVDGGRERRPNGETPLDADEEGQFLVSAKSTLRVVQAS